MSAIIKIDQKEGEKLCGPESKPAAQWLEAGNVLLFDTLDFPLSDEEKELLDPEILAGNRKNVSFDPRTRLVKGAQCSSIKESQLRAMMARYCEFAFKLVSKVFENQVKHLKIDKTSLRPAEIATREDESTRKNDKKLHVDAFPSNPTGGARILRVFTNINPSNKPRIWKIGEPFSKVALRFIPAISSPLPFIAKLMHHMHITKSRRSAYDHYMLKIHDKMKASDHYQENVESEMFSFQPGSTWMVFTDQVSHAVLSGQHVLEQTFWVSDKGLSYKETSPCHVLETMLGKKLT